MMRVAVLFFCILLIASCRSIKTVEEGVDTRVSDSIWRETEREVRPDVSTNELIPLSVICDTLETKIIDKEFVIDRTTIRFFQDENKDLRLAIDQKGDTIERLKREVQKRKEKEIIREPYPVEIYRTPGWNWVIMILLTAIIGLLIKRK